MKRIFTVTLVTILFLCKGTNGPDESASSINYVWELYMPNDSMPGWEEDRARYRIYDAVFLYDLIDGGADKFDNQGLVAGIVQVMFFDTLYENIIYVMDFGSANKAKGMLNTMKTVVGGMPLSLPGFDTATAAATPALGGNTTYAWFSRFYIELYLSGYSDQEKSLQDAATFLAAYKRKIEQ